MVYKELSTRPILQCRKLQFSEQCEDFVFLAIQICEPWVIGNLTNSTALKTSQVLLLEVGANGQPESRVSAFNDSLLSSSTYNMQGREYTTVQDIPVNNTITLTASLYIPGEWIDNNPAASSCQGNTSCIRNAEFGIELGYQVNQSYTRPAFTSKFGFDNRLTNSSGNGPYLYLLLDGYATETPSWPYSPLGTKLIFAFPSILGPVPGWEGNIINRDGWNQFSVSLGLWNHDWAWNPTFRNCQQVLMIRW